MVLVWVLVSLISSFALKCFAEQDLALGDGFGVGIVEGTLFSFGKNNIGQLGTGSLMSNVFSDEVQFLEEFSNSRIVAVYAGFDYAAAVDSSGILYTWGSGEHGKLGHGQLLNKDTPTAVNAFGSGVVSSVSCGRYSMYATDSNGELFGWGRNHRGQLGRPISSVVDRTTPNPILVAEKSVSKFSAGREHVCAITYDDKALYCWGEGAHGKLGNGDNADRDQPTLVFDASSTNNEYIQVGCGDEHSCAMDKNGNMLCFGNGGNGRLGQGMGMSSSRNVPTLVVNEWDDTANMRLLVGAHHSCIYSDVKAKCWGLATNRWIPKNRADLTANGDADVPVEMKMDGINGIASLAAGQARTCVKDDDGVIFCYGMGQMTMYEYEKLDFSTVGLPILSRFPQLALGLDFGVFVFDGEVFSFGKNSEGQLGIGFVENDGPTSEVHRIDEFGNGGIVAVSVGWIHAAAIDAHGTLFTWGNGAHGRLGHSNNARQTTPTAVTPFGSGIVVIVSCGYQSSYAIDSEGSLFAWGNNNMGQLGLPLDDVPYSNVPVKILVESKKVLSVSGGHSHVCVITEEYFLYCFGNGGQGRLGNGDNQNREAPTLVTNVADSSGRYTQIGCGRFHSCGVDTDSNVLCWGRGSGGELGLGRGNTAIKYVPHLVAKTWGRESIDEVVVGFTTTCVHADAKAWCFGLASNTWIPDNPNELTVSGTAEFPIAVKMDGINGVEQMAIGKERMCIKAQDGVMSCYGADLRNANNEYGVLDFSRYLTSSTTPKENPVVVTSDVRTTPQPTEDNSGVSSEGEDSEKEIGPEIEPIVPTDNTIYIVSGSILGALVAAVAFVIVTFKICGPRNAKRRAVRQGGGASLGTNNKGTGRVTSHSSRSKAASCRSSVSMKSAGSGGGHAKRRSLKVMTGSSAHGSNPHYGQIRLNNVTSENEYDTVVLSREKGSNVYDAPNASLNLNPSSPYESVSFQVKDTANEYTDLQLDDEARNAEYDSVTAPMNATIEVETGNTYESVTAAL